MTPVENLTEARKLLLHGWGQGRYIHALDPDQHCFLGLSRDAKPEQVKCYCLTGAIGMAQVYIDPKQTSLTILNEKQPVWQAIGKALGLEEDDITISNIAAWNDDPERTKDEVLFVLDHALTILESAQ